MQNPFSRDNPFVLKEKPRLNNSCSSGCLLSSLTPTTLQNSYLRPKQLRKRGKLPNPFFKKHLLSDLDNIQEQKPFGDIQYILLSSNFRDSRKNSQKYAQNDQQSWRWRQVDQPQQLSVNIRSNHRIQSNRHEMKRDSNRHELNRIELNRIDSNRYESNRIDSNRHELNRIEVNRIAAQKETDRQEREIVEKVELSAEMRINQQVRKKLKEKFIESRREIQLQQEEEGQIRLRGKVYTRCQVLAT